MQLLFCYVYSDLARNRLTGEIPRLLYWNEVLQYLWVLSFLFVFFFYVWLYLSRSLTSRAFIWDCSSMQWVTRKHVEWYSVSWYMSINWIVVFVSNPTQAWWSFALDLSCNLTSVFNFFLLFFSMISKWCERQQFDWYYTWQHRELYKFWNLVSQVTGVWYVLYLIFDNCLIVATLLFHWISETYHIIRLLERFHIILDFCKLLLCEYFHCEIIVLLLAVLWIDETHLKNMYVIEYYCDFCPGHFKGID